MNKEKLIISIIYLLFGILFVVTGLCFYGALNEGISFFAGFARPSGWIFGVFFGGVLALRAWFSKPAGQNK